MKFSQSWRVRTGMMLLAAVTFARPAEGQQTLAELPPEVLAYADTVLFNGKVLTADDQFSVAEAVAIRDGKFLAVGTSERILKMAGPETQRLDLRGDTAVPGFIDTHNHLGDYILRYMFLEDRGVQYEGELLNVTLLWANREMALRDIERFARATPPGELVQLTLREGPERLRQWQLTREELDRVAPDNPLFLHSNNLRPIAINTAVLKWAPIPEDLPGAPAPGEIFISGLAARRLEDRLRWATPLPKLEEWHRKIMERANSWGLTTVATRIRPESFTALREIWVKEQMTMRWRVAFPGPLDIPRTGNLTDIGDDLLRIAGAGGGFVPGDPAALGIWLFDPPLHPLPVESENPQEWLARWPQGRDAMVEAWRYGWSIPNSHVKGDLAAFQFLRAVEEAQKNPMVPTSRQRFTIDHNLTVRPQEIEKMKDLGVIPSLQVRGLFATYDRNQMIPVFGVDRLSSRFLTIRSFLEAGVRPTVEADSGDSNHGRPLWKIEKIVTRKDDEGRVWGPDQKVSRQEALWMNTSWAAHYTGDEKILGTIEPGKLADLVILEGDYLTVPEDQISQLSIRMTLVGGRIVHEATAASH